MLTFAHHALRIANHSKGAEQFDDDMNQPKTQIPSRGIALIRLSITSNHCRKNLKTRLSCADATTPIGTYRMSFTLPNRPINSLSNHKSAGLFSPDRSADANCQLTHHNRLQYMHCNEPAERPAGISRRIHGSTQEEGSSNSRRRSTRTEATCEQEIWQEEGTTRKGQEG